MPHYPTPAKQRKAKLRFSLKALLPTNILLDLVKSTSLFNNQILCLAANKKQKDKEAIERVKKTELKMKEALEQAAVAKLKSKQQLKDKAGKASHGSTPSTTQAILSQLRAGHSN